MQDAIEEELVYFLHIPTTSGTSLHHSFQRVCGSGAVCPQLLWDDLVDGTY
jgi:hypothetical protein